MNFILSDGNYRQALLPFTYTRPIASIRIGITTIQEKWEYWLNDTVSFLTEGYLATKYPLRLEKDNIVVNASFLPDAILVNAIQSLQYNEVLLYEDEVVAYRTGAPEDAFERTAYNEVSYENEILTIKHTWDIFSKNDAVLRNDFQWVTKGRKSMPISSTNTVIGAEHIFLEEGTSVECSILNATTGPIYLGKHAQVMEGCVIRGGLALGEHAVLKMGAKLYGANTFGPFCKVGGEVNNSVLFAYSNKGHEGFLGNSVLGEWCNLGADTNTSNLKNNYAQVRLWDYKTEGFAKTGLQFCGLIMGDHSKCGINTMFNTGTVVGVSANVFGSGYPRNFIPSYSWGGASGFTTYRTVKAFETATAMMARRNMEFNADEKAILEHVFEITQKWHK